VETRAANKSDYVRAGGLKPCTGDDMNIKPSDNAELFARIRTVWREARRGTTARISRIIPYNGITGIV
jgi:DNA-binding response OmpR family regulator